MNQTSVEIVTTEAALEQMNAYQEQSPINRQRLQEAIHALRQQHATHHVLTETTRPIYHHPIDTHRGLYFIYGRHLEHQELRIIFLGPVVSDSPSFLKELLRWTGEQDSTRKAVPKDLSSPTPPDDPPAEADDLEGLPYRRIPKTVRRPHDHPVRLSSRQRRLIGLPGPHFVQGVAGSGKTTLLAHLAHQELLRSGNQSSILIIAYTESLRMFINKTISTLSTNEPVDTSGIATYHWRELCDNLATIAGLAPFRWVNDNEAVNIVRLNTRDRSRNRGNIAVDVQEFIRATLKGNVINPDDPLIGREEFYALPKTPLDNLLKRGEQYELATLYQHSLVSQGLVDTIDAARILFSCRAKLPKFDHVLLDETQDYTWAELRLIACLAKRREALFFVGDMDQVVYPSHFSWGRVQFAVRQVWPGALPEIVELNYNYRNPLPIFDLANVLTSLRHSSAGSKPDQTARSNQPATNALPLRVVVTKEESRAVLQQLATSFGSLGVIQKNEEHIDIEGIEFQRLFTPQNVKGLEFDIVCLINFGEIYRELVLKNTRLTNRQALLKHSEVYVSVTRTRKQLILLDWGPLRDGLWDLPVLANRITTARDAGELLEIVSARFKLQDPEEWQTSAIDFEDQQAFCAAAECWERGNRPDRAARAYEQGGRLEKARELYLATNDIKGAARLSERLGMFADAGRLFAGLAQFERAAECWLRAQNIVEAAGAYREAAQSLGRRDLWQEAGKHYKDARRLNEAARCYEAASEWKSAGECWLLDHAYLEASKCFAQAGEASQANMCQAKHFEGQGLFVNAAQCWELAGRLDMASKCWEQGGELKKAQEHMVAVGNFAGSAQLLLAMGRRLDAAEHFKMAGEVGRSAYCLQEEGEWQRAAEQWEALGEGLSAATCYEKAQAWGKAARLWLHLKAPLDAARCYEREGDWFLAALIWRNANQFEESARCYERASAWARAGDMWARAGNMGLAAPCYETVGNRQTPPSTKSTDMATQRTLLDHKSHMWLENMIDVDALHQLIQSCGHEHHARQAHFEGLKEYVRAKIATIGGMQLPSMTGLCDALALELDGRSEQSGQYWASLNATSPQGDPEKCTRVLFARVVDLAQAYLSGSDQQLNEEIASHVEKYARVFALCDQQELAARLFEETGDFPCAALSYTNMGMHREASKLYLRAGDRRSAAHSLEMLKTDQALAEAVILWLELENFDKASKILDVLGKNRLSLVCSAINFERQGDRVVAETYWRQLGIRSPGAQYQEHLNQLRSDLKNLIDVAPSLGPPAKDAAMGRGKSRLLRRAIRLVMLWAGWLGRKVKGPPQ